MLLYFSIFLAGITLGVFGALYFFAPEKQEDIWDPQHFPATDNSSILKSVTKTNTKTKAAIINRA